MSTDLQQRFAGKTALISGGGTGMGRAAAIRLGLEGANVVVVGRRQEPLDEVVSLIASEGGQAFAVAADISEEADVKNMVTAAVERYGSLDLVWNNAGILGEFKPLSETTADEFDAVMSVNLRGIFLSLKYELEAILASGNAASIVNTSSWTAHGAMPGIASYAATKGALDAMMRTVALEVGDKQIRINNVSPGIIATPMGVSALGSKEAFAPFAKHTPLQREGTSEDVGDAVLWLLSEDARFVTGQSIMVDGGFTLGGLRPQFIA